MQSYLKSPSLVKKLDKKYKNYQFLSFKKLKNTASAQLCIIPTALAAPFQWKLISLRHPRHRDLPALRCVHHAGHHCQQHLAGRRGSCQRRQRQEHFSRAARLRVYLYIRHWSVLKGQFKLPVFHYTTVSGYVQVGINQHHLYIYVYVYTLFKGHSHTWHSVGIVWP